MTTCRNGCSRFDINCKFYKAYEKRYRGGYDEDLDKAYEVASKLALHNFHEVSITYYDAAEIGLKMLRAIGALRKLLVQLHILYRERVLELERDLLEGVRRRIRLF